MKAHGLSAFETTRPTLRPFRYVDMGARKGGVFSQIRPKGSTTIQSEFLTFNSLSTYILKGDEARKAPSTQF
jgi:hypothetical protein